MVLRVKRACEESEKSDGELILVDRIWPRGLSKEKVRLSEWRKDPAPSGELRKWFGHDPERWEEFVRRYQVELEKGDKLEELRELGRQAEEDNVTLLFAAKVAEHNKLHQTAGIRGSDVCAEIGSQGGRCERGTHERIREQNIAGDRWVS